MSSSLSLLALFAALFSTVLGQTWTDCNPMNQTCSDDVALGISNYTVDFTQALDANVWNTTNGFITPTSNGSEFTITQRYQSPTIQSIFNIFFGVVEIHMKAATGQGIISSIVIQSDDLDEIDWEFRGGNTTTVQSNYFGKGNQTSFDRAEYHDVADAMSEYHNYTTHWTSEKIEWIVDGQVLRTLNYGDALGGYNFPQTPSTVRLGIWAGGDPSNSNGTIEWAGGESDFTRGPYTMHVQSAKVTDYGTGKAYHWSDHSGSWESVKSVAGNSTVVESIVAAPSATSETVAQKWNDMSSTAKIGVYAGSAVGGVAIAALIALCCLKQRRRGQADRAAEEARQEAQRRQAAEFEGMPSKEQDQLPLSAMTPAEYERSPNAAAKGRYYDPSIAESDVGSIHKYNINGVEPRPTTPMVAVPPVYHNNGVGSNGYAPAAMSGGAHSPSDDFHSPPPQYAQPTSNTGGFNFNANAPSRSFSERAPTGYSQVPAASPMYGGFPQQQQQQGQGQAYPGRSFSAAPQMNHPPPQQQERW